MSLCSISAFRAFGVSELQEKDCRPPSPSFGLLLLWIFPNIDKLWLWILKVNMTIQAIWKSHSGSYSQVSDIIKVQSMRINSTYIKARGKPGDNKPGKKYNRQLFMTHLNLLEIQTSSPISLDQPFHLLCDTLFSRTALWETTIIKPFVRTNKTDNTFTPGRAELQGWVRNHRAVYLAFGKERPS